MPISDPFCRRSGETLACVCVCVCVYVTLGVLGILPDLFYFVLSQGVQAAHPVLHQRRHWMCAGDIELGRQIDVPACSQAVTLLFHVLIHGSLHDTSLKPFLCRVSCS